jgi:hypothetical protein
MEANALSIRNVILYSVLSLGAKHLKIRVLSIKWLLADSRRKVRMNSARMSLRIGLKGIKPTLEHAKLINGTSVDAVSILTAPTVIRIANSISALIVKNMSAKRMFVQ